MPSHSTSVLKVRQGVKVTTSQVALGRQMETRCLEISLELNGFPWLDGCLLPRTPVLSLDQCPPQEFLGRIIDQKMLLTRGDKELRLLENL